MVHAISNLVLQVDMAMILHKNLHARNALQVGQASAVRSNAPTVPKENSPVILVFSAGTAQEATTSHETQQKVSNAINALRVTHKATQGRVHVSVSIGCDLKIVGPINTSTILTSTL